MDTLINEFNLINEIILSKRNCQAELAEVVLLNENIFS